VHQDEDLDVICFDPVFLEARDQNVQEEIAAARALEERRRRARTVSRIRACPSCWHELDWIPYLQEYVCLHCSHREYRGTPKAR